MVKVRTSTAPKSMRLDWPDGRIIALGFFPKGKTKSSVALSHAKLPDRDTANALKLYWSAQLDSLGDLLASQTWRQSPLPRMQAGARWCQPSSSRAQKIGQLPTARLAGLETAQETASQRAFYSDGRSSPPANEAGKSGSQPLVVAACNAAYCRQYCPG